MAKEYKVGDTAYVPVVVENSGSGRYDYTVAIKIKEGGDRFCFSVSESELETAEEICEKRLGKAFEENYPTFTELKARNAELEALLKEVMATRDEAIQQNNELIAENDSLRSQAGKQLAQIQDLNAEIHFLKEKSGKQKPEEEATMTVHVVLNDGTGYNFFKCTKASFDNYGDFTVLKIYRGEEYVAGFLRGDKPGNFAYWWTE